MSIEVQTSLSVIGVLEPESIFVMTRKYVISQDIRPLRIVILSLMPIKIETGVQLLRLLGNPLLQADVELMHMVNHFFKNTFYMHTDIFHKTFDGLKDDKSDRMIITGASAELMGFENVDYWSGLCETFA